MINLALSRLLCKKCDLNIPFHPRTSHLPMPLHRDVIPCPPDIKVPSMVARDGPLVLEVMGLLPRTFLGTGGVGGW